MLRLEPIQRAHRLRFIDKILVKLLTLDKGLNRLREYRVGHQKRPPVEAITPLALRQKREWPWDCEYE